jgi:hypothetical protein
MKLMKKLEFLIIGKNQYILETLIRLININEEWHGEGFSEENLAKDYFSKYNVDIVLFSSGIEENSEREMRSFFVSKQPEIEIIQHYGGGSGLLKCEILEALEQRPRLKLIKNQA